MNTATDPTCWICGARADTREHRIKRSDLARRYGNQPFKYVGGMLHFVGEEAREVQGPNARPLTYESMLCRPCNNTTSQPWDRAYEQFERWLFDHETLVLDRRFILFEEVYGTDAFPAACPALYKYFVKAFGCRLTDAGMSVPVDLVTLLLSEERFLTKLRLTFSVNKALFDLDEQTRRDYLGLGELIRFDSRSRGVMERYAWHMQIGWLRVWFFYDMDVPCGIGSVWTSDSACIYLGEFETARVAAK